MFQESLLSFSSEASDDDRDISTPEVIYHVRIFFLIPKF